MIKLLIGGSPCTNWSAARGGNGRETEPEGIGWELFKNYLIAKDKFCPDFFLYENNQSAAQPIKDQISKSLGVELMNINSALVSAQNRPRFYAFNWSVDLPADRGIEVADILDDIDCGPIGYIKPSVRVNIEREYEAIVACQDKKLWKCDCTCSWADNVVGLKKSPTIRANNRCCVVRDKNNRIRMITLTEAERLQTLPEGYTLGVPDTQRHKGIGNGWTAEVIIHILSGALKDIPKDEEIVVLSMYDGIGTGRYCLDKMGFTNVTYYAYEIDEYAMRIALSNYPDIIQLGDAFNVHRDDWELGKTYADAPPTETQDKEPEQTEPTDPSDAPEDIKEAIIENAEKLEAAPKTETTEETMKPTNIEEQTNTKENTPTDFCAVAQLRRLADERKALANLRPEDPRFSNDVRALEYAATVLEAVGL